MQKPKYFLNALAVLSFILLSCQVLPVQAQLPPEMQMDVLMTELKQVLKAKNHRKVLSVTAKLRKLSADLPHSILFIEARALAAIKQNTRAKKSLEEYLKKSGKDGKFYGEAIKLYVAVNEKVENANRAQAKSQAVKKQAMRKREQATTAARNKRLRQILKLPGQPKEFARLPDGRFAVLGTSSTKVGRYRFGTNIWVKFFQANGKIIRTFEHKAPTGGAFFQGGKGLTVFPGGKYLLGGNTHLGEIKMRRNARSTCQGPFMFSGDGKLLPRESYLPEILAQFEPNKGGSCRGRVKISPAPDGTSILVTSQPGGDEIVYRLNSAGKILERQHFKISRFYKYSNVFALADKKFITLGRDYTYKLHQGLQTVISNGQIPADNAKGHGREFVGVAPLPSGGWSFLLKGKVGSWKNGVKGFSAKGAALWHAKPSCGVAMRNAWPRSLWSQGNSLFAIYKPFNSNRAGGYQHCVQQISASGRTIGRGYSIREIFTDKFSGEKIVGFAVEPKSGDRIFVINAHNGGSDGYLMRTDAKLRQKQW